MAERKYKDPIKEARRYIANAKELLNSKADNDGYDVSDPKFVKMAGHALWTGCLIAMDAVFQIPKPKNGRIDIKDYQMAAAKRDEKMQSLLHTGYEMMHLGMGYDGVTDADYIKLAIARANSIVDWCEKRIPVDN